MNKTLQPVPFKPLKNLPAKAEFKAGDVLVVFGELFSRGYANGIVDEAERAGMTVIRSTVGRRDENEQLRPLNDSEMASHPKPFINIPMEAGFDLEPASDGTRPVDMMKGAKMAEWDKVQLDWDKINESKKRGEERFKKNLRSYMTELEKHIPNGANVLFVHTMAGGVPRAKIYMPTMNRIFKGTGDRHVSSAAFSNSDLGKFAEINFDEVTANTFQYLLEGSESLRQKIEKNGGRARYVAYGYHGTEVLIRGEYRWQTYTPYFQGWAKMRLENFATEAWKKGVKATVFNCPEILTNSSSVFQGVEVSLYPMLGALKKEGARSKHCQNILRECQALLKPEFNADEVLRFTDSYLTSSLTQAYTNYEKWPGHNGKEQMEYMLQSSDHLFAMHQEAGNDKKLMTSILSEEIFKATGIVMLNEAWNPKEPVWWLGHDVLAKALAQD